MDYKGKADAAQMQEEIEVAYVKYRTKLVIFVRAGISETEAVEDIVQEVFLEALKKYDLFRNHPNQMGWLYQTAKYKIKEYHRKMQAVDMVEIDEETEELGNVESGYLKTELELYVKEMLTPEERLRYYRYFLWGYTAEEIARQEGVSLNNMRVRLTRLKQKLKILQKSE